MTLRLVAALVAAIAFWCEPLAAQTPMTREGELREALTFFMPPPTTEREVRRLVRHLQCLQRELEPEWCNNYQKKHHKNVLQRALDIALVCQEGFHLGEPEDCLMSLKRLSAWAAERTPREQPAPGQPLKN